ncbi:MAG: hypothetical protein ACREQ4_16520 [Candidatus Binataceae bacterium]
MTSILALQLEGISEAATKCAVKINSEKARLAGSRFADISRFLGNVLFEFEKLAEASTANWPAAFHQEFGIVTADNDDDEAPDKSRLN